MLPFSDFIAAQVATEFPRKPHLHEDMTAAMVNVMSGRCVGSLFAQSFAELMMRRRNILSRGPDSLAEFRDSRMELRGELLQRATDDCCDCAHAFVYADGLWIDADPDEHGVYHLTIGNEQHSGTVTELEDVLYQYWLDECQDSGDDTAIADASLPFANGVDAVIEHLSELGRDNSINPVAAADMRGLAALLQDLVTDLNRYRGNGRA